MKEIVERLHENRQIELAKSILESNGYEVRLKEEEAASLPSLDGVASASDNLREFQEEMSKAAERRREELKDFSTSLIGPYVEYKGYEFSEDLDPQEVKDNYISEVAKLGYTEKSSGIGTFIYSKDGRMIDVSIDSNFLFVRLLSPYTHEELAHEKKLIKSYKDAQKTYLKSVDWNSVELTNKAPENISYAKLFNSDIPPAKLRYSGRSIFVSPEGYVAMFSRAPQVGTPFYSSISDQVFQKSIEDIRSLLIAGKFTVAWEKP